MPIARGRGPKNYRRSDSRLRDEIAERLMYHADIDSSDVTLEVEDAKVTLEGTVPERWMRYAVDDIAESVIGVADVNNRVRVHRTWESLRAEALGGERGTHHE
jgi:osmotically-inducible protein OsmY